jgi:hypothetical protein
MTSCGSSNVESKTEEIDNRKKNQHGDPENSNMEVSAFREGGTAWLHIDGYSKCDYSHGRSNSKRQLHDKADGTKHMLGGNFDGCESGYAGELKRAARPIEEKYDEDQDRGESDSTMAHKALDAAVMISLTTRMRR